MSTYRELTYIVLDELKLSSDDSYYTEDHIIFLLNNYRAFLLKQRYSDIKKQIPESNYQTICLSLIQVPATTGECESGEYLRSVEKVPFLMQIGAPRVYCSDYYSGDISYISRDRMRFVGYNKYLQNIIYSSLHPDNHLYFKTFDISNINMTKVKMTAIFLNPQEAVNLMCLEENEILPDILDVVFPIEESLIPPLVELVIKELQGNVYKPEDENNNAKDDLSNVTTKSNGRN